MTNGLLNTDDLKAWTGYDQTASLRQWMDKPPIRIPYKKLPNGGICTTLDMVNEALRQGKELPLSSVEKAPAWEA